MINVKSMINKINADMNVSMYEFNEIYLSTELNADNQKNFYTWRSKLLHFFIL